MRCCVTLHTRLQHTIMSKHWLYVGPRRIFDVDKQSQSTVEVELELSTLFDRVISEICYTVVV